MISAPRNPPSSRRRLPRTEIRDSATDHASIRFELRLAWSSKTHAPANSRKVSPHSLQPGKQVLKLRQLDLHLGLAGTSASSEDVEDELRTIENTNTDQILQGFALRRCKLIVEDHEIRLSGGYTFPKLVGLTLTDVEARMGVVEPLADDIYDLTARGVGQPCQLLEMLLSGVLMEGFERSTHQYHAFHDRAVVDQLRRNSGLLGG